MAGHTSSHAKLAGSESRGCGSPLGHARARLLSICIEDAASGVQNSSQQVEPKDLRNVFSCSYGALKSGHVVVV